jgi:SAM-dependent methyltransferase
MNKWVTRAKGWARKAEDMALRLASVAGLAQSEERIAAQAREVWRDPSTKDLASHSHACGHYGAGTGIDPLVWKQIGEDAYNQFRDAANALHMRWLSGVVLDYGCGHGAQASAFAKHTDEIIGVDIQPDALEEFATNVRAASEFVNVSTVTIDEPEDMLTRIQPSTVDAFVSYYTFELIPGQRYGERILRVAFELMRPGAIGFVQFKYPTGRWDETRRRGYSTRNLADTTKYRPDEFWAMVERAGFTPGHITIVERDVLDKHYGYMSFVKPGN